jgi:glycosyltransferase involved in cell wall biosynthesis
MREFSVVVLLYNSQKEQLCRTLDSILCQRDVDWELILADDASENNCLKEAQEYLQQKGYTSYKTKSHKKNVGTVQNLYDAMEEIEGKYVKCIGAGDFLLEDTTLKKVFDYMEKTSATMCFGKMQAYREVGKKIDLCTLLCPADVEAFEKEQISRIKKNIIQNHGWIVGASMFYLGEKFKKYLKVIIGTVRFCEDLLQVILLMEGEKICYLKEGVIYYELGSGISTAGGINNSARMKQDHDMFWNMTIEKYSGNHIIKKGYQMHQYECISGVRQRQLQIMLHNPDYVWMLFRTAFQKKKYEVKEQGMLQELYQEKC